jgi:hypothetical protein
MGVLSRSAVTAALAIAGIVAGTATPAAQDSSLPEVTAGYLVNFVRFTTWPAETLSAGAPIVVCVSGDGWVADALARLTRGRAINGRTVSVRQIARDGAHGDCQLIYGADLDRDSAQRLIRTTSNRSVFTVSDTSDFAERGGIANLFVDNGRMRFAVNPGAAVRARLQISSKLLSLARIVGS